MLDYADWEQSELLKETQTFNNKVKPKNKIKE